MRRRGEGDAGPFGAGGSKFSTYEHDYEMLLFSSLSASLFASFLEMPSSLVEFLSFSLFFFFFFLLYGIVLIFTLVRYFFKLY